MKHIILIPSQACTKEVFFCDSSITLGIYYILYLCMLYIYQSCTGFQDLYSFLWLLQPKMFDFGAAFFKICNLLSFFVVAVELVKLQLNNDVT